VWLCRIGRVIRPIDIRGAKPIDEPGHRRAIDRDAISGIAENWDSEPSEVKLRTATLHNKGDHTGRDVLNPARSICHALSRYPSPPAVGHDAGVVKRKDRLSIDDLREGS